MPELPDILVYLEHLATRILGKPIVAVEIANPFVLRSVTPPIGSVVGRKVVDLRRMGKRVVLGVEGDLFIVIHLMIAGRLRWRPPGKRLPGKLALAAFSFSDGTLFLSEAGSTRRASIYVVSGEDALSQFDRGGLEVLDAELGAFSERLRSENHTLKRSLTDPRLFSGIGNSYSDEILHRARLSPLALTSRLSGEEIERLFEATRSTLLEWTARLRKETGDEFPEKVTAFREGMAVHGRFGQPCPVCGTPVQRIRYKSNETNYCARCQTGGRLLADRGLSRLLKQDWPRSIDEVE
ncbi:MAG TPA: DNA-formamidopyrimidine glycosylase family protein [Gemmatimonadaceae bacterium]|nr:DNA-formamidopyrimidine glycosylase family protein [Gemmatimonadaceae bacterium]